MPQQYTMALQPERCPSLCSASKVDSCSGIPRTLDLRVSLT
uniref:Alternative protein WNT16 n=1 Tax=Homo sapiens TaxID=9606 RepID=L8ECG6_HUMAN|nr:alternative protein WNT16 [Homo sapiens]